MYPIGRYNLNFDLCAAVLNGVLLLSLLLRKNTRSKKVRIFAAALLMMLVTSLCEFGTGALQNLGVQYPDTALEILTAGAHLSFILVEFFIALYLMILTGRIHGLKGRYLFLFCLPEIILILFIAGTALQKGFLSYDILGIPGWTLLKILYLVMMGFYAVYCLVLLFRYRRVVRQEFIYVISFSSGFLVSLALEIVLPYMRAALFVQSMFMICCFLFLGSGEEMQEPETGLYSRYALRREIELLYGTGYSSYVLAVKLQGMEHYSAILGSDILSRVMLQIGNWLRSLYQMNVSVFRVGTGEFAIVMYNASEKSARELAERIRRRFGGLWNCSDTEVAIPAQVWLTSVPDRAKTPEQLFVFATATYNSNLPLEEVYVADEMKNETRKLAVERAIRRALDNQAFDVYYQPIYDTKSGRIHSAEALVRLTDSELGAIPPDEFIPIAEKTGTVSHIGEIVFEKVCRFLAEQRPERYGLQFVEVNLSTVQCMDLGIVERMKAIADMYNISPQRINLEITETAVVYSEITMKRVMGLFQEAGFGFSLDDFGTGNSNYSYLLKYPFRLIKIDKSFLWACENNQNNQVIFDNMLHLIRDLHLQAVVEGVETKRQREDLISRGVDYLQGYYYSKPLPEDGFMFYLRHFDF